MLLCKQKSTEIRIRHFTLFKVLLPDDVNNSTGHTITFSKKSRYLSYFSLIVLSAILGLYDIILIRYSVSNFYFSQPNFSNPNVRTGNTIGSRIVCWIRVEGICSPYHSLGTLGLYRGAPRGRYLFFKYGIASRGHPLQKRKKRKKM